MSQRAGQRPEPRSSPGATAFLCVFLSSSHRPPPMVRAGLSSNPEGQRTFLLESVLRLFSKWGKHQGCAGGVSVVQSGTRAGLGASSSSVVSRRWVQLLPWRPGLLDSLGIYPIPTIPDLERDTHSLFCAFQDDVLELVSFTPQLGRATSVRVFGQVLFGVILSRFLVWLVFEGNYHLNL